MGFNEAVAAAISCLARKEKFTAEVRELLLKKGFEAETVDQAIEHLTRKNLLNDRRCAELAIARLTAKGDLGRTRVIASLEHRGAAPELIKELLPDDPDPESLQEVLRKHFPKGAEEARALRYLGSRGFEEDEARSAVNQFLASVE